MRAVTRRSFLRTTLGASGAACLGGTAWAKPPALFPGESDPAIADQLGLSSAERTRLRQMIKLRLMDLALVVPAPDDAPRHLGWPVATRLSSGRTIVVYRRNPGHGDEAIEPPNGRYVTYSDDLVHWLPSDQFSPAARLGLARGMHCIGSALVDGRERAIVVTSGDPGRYAEVFYSDDQGVSWSKNDTAFDGMLKDSFHCGPNLVTHPTFGLMAAFSQERGRRRRNTLVRTLDGGQNWAEHHWVNSLTVRSVEPSMVTWGPGHILLLSRAFGDDAELGDSLTAYGQHVYRFQPDHGFDAIDFASARTNILARVSPDGFGGNDTAEVIFNPVSGRLEALQSHRLGGGPEDESFATGKPESTLNLWSIDPEALLAGDSKWRYDGTLLRRRGIAERGERDGLHPGGSIVDLALGQQHIFFYAGWRRSPASIFRISRSLHTDDLRAAFGVA